MTNEKGNQRGGETCGEIGRRDEMGRGFLSPDKIQYGKSSPSMGSPPPPPPIAHAVPILHMEFVLEEICHRGGRFAIWYYFPWGSSAMGFLPGVRFAIWYYFPLGKFCYGISSGGKVCHMVLFPPGEVLLWDFFRGEVCHMVFLHGERLPYFGGQSAKQSPHTDKIFIYFWNLQSLLTHLPTWT